MADSTGQYPTNELEKAALLHVHARSGIGDDFGDGSPDRFSTGFEHGYLCIQVVLLVVRADSGIADAYS